MEAVKGTPAEKEEIARKALEEEKKSLPSLFKESISDLTEEQLITIKVKPLAEMFGIKEITKNNQDDLVLLYKWVLSERGSDEKSDLVAAIKQLAWRIGIPMVSADSLRQMVNWVRADLAEKEARKEKQLYERTLNA